MIRQRAFEVDPWKVREKALNLDLLAQSESVFALSNGHIGLRGNLDEGEPHGLPGTYLGGFFEMRPLPYAEAGYGYPESGQTVVNVTNGKLIRLLVGDSLFDVRYGTLRRHERTLDLRAGTLTREVEWVTPTGHPIRIRSIRLVSFAQRAIAAIMFEVEPLGGAARVVLQSELVANEPIPPAGGDPRAAAVATPLRSEYTSGHDLRAVMVHTTDASNLRLAVAMDHLVEGPDGVDTDIEAHADFARATITCEAGPGKPLRVFKGLAYGWSSQRSMPAVRDQVEGALTGAQHTGWEALLTAQRQFLDAFWSRGRRRDRRRAAPAAGAAVRDVPRPAGRGPRRGPGDRGQGADRARATTDTRSGTPRRSCCRCSPTRSPTPRRRRSAGATRPCRWPRSAPRSSA